VEAPKELLFDRSWQFRPMYHGKMMPKNFGCFCIFQKTAQSKQSPPIDEKSPNLIT
jgi:hypothetical protein